MYTINPLTRCTRKEITSVSRITAVALSLGSLLQSSPHPLLTNLLSTQPPEWSFWSASRLKTPLSAQCVHALAKCQFSGALSSFHPFSLDYGQLLCCFSHILHQLWPLYPLLSPSGMLCHLLITSSGLCSTITFPESPSLNILYKNSIPNTPHPAHSTYFSQST